MAAIKPNPARQQDVQIGEHKYRTAKWTEAVSDRVLDFADLREQLGDDARPREIVPGMLELADALIEPVSGNGDTPAPSELLRESYDAGDLTIFDLDDFLSRVTAVAQHRPR